MNLRRLNTELVGLSVDSLYAHIAWLRKIQELEWNGMKDIEVTFPLIEDIRMEVSNKYGMIQPGQSNTQAVRAVFVVDPEGKIRTILYYPLSTGRNFDEIKRIILALQKADSDSVATPADWRPGDDVIVPPPLLRNRQGAHGESVRRPVLPGLVPVLPQGEEGLIHRRFHRPRHSPYGRTY